MGKKESDGCTFGTTWRDYPFLRMANVHVEPGPENSPTREQLIGDMKNGVIIDGRGSYSIDQQRYNGQFGGHIFWEIKNGKVTRQCTDVTYNAITTDFWKGLDEHHRPEGMADARHRRRRKGSANADQQHQPWQSVVAHSQDAGGRSV